MTRPGRKPKSAQSLVASGSDRANRRKKSTEAAAASPTVPDPPAFLQHPYAVEAWKHFAPILYDVDALRCADEWTLARYCSVFARWRETEDVILREGQTEVIELQNQLTRTVKRAEVLIAKELLGELMKFEREFGLTPASRIGIIEANTPRDKNTKASERAAEAEKRQAKMRLIS